MYTCRTCKLLKYSQSKKSSYQDEDGEIIEYKSEAHSIVDLLSECHCPYYWWSIKPSPGFGCKHWQNMNGKHWI